MNSTLFGLILYLVLIAFVATWTWGKNRTKEDFILGGRRLGAWVIAFSERTSAESAWLILGLSGALYSLGLRDFRPKAVQSLTASGIIGKTQDGRYYLNEGRLDSETNPSPL